MKEYDFKYIYVKNTEADDNIGVITNSLIEFREKQQIKLDIYIITNDYDFLQLLKYENVYIYSLAGNFLNNKVIGKDVEELTLQKIVRGDKSDNISSIFNFHDCNYYCNNYDSLYQLLKGDDNIKDKYLKNRTLISFDWIPEIIKKNIIDEFLKIFYTI